MNNSEDPIQAEDEKDLVWKAVNTRHIIKDNWIDFREVEYRMPDGSTFSPFYNYSRKDYVVIVATDEDGKYLTVKQFRHGIRCVTNEFVAGGIERTEPSDITKPAHIYATLDQALAAAKRELQEGFL